MGHCIQTEMCFSEGGTEQHSMECAMYQGIVVDCERFIVSQRAAPSCLCDTETGDHSTECWRYQAAKRDAIETAEHTIATYSRVFRDVFGSEVA